MSISTLSTLSNAPYSIHSLPLSICPSRVALSKARAGSNTLSRAAPLFRLSRQLPSVEPTNPHPQLISPPTKFPSRVVFSTLAFSYIAHRSTAQPLNCSSSTKKDIEKRKKDEDDKADCWCVEERQGSSNRYAVNDLFRSSSIISLFLLTLVRARARSHPRYSRSVRDDQHGHACHVTYHD